MTILSRYVTREFYKLFAGCEVVFVFLFLTVDFLQKIDNFMEAKATKAAVLLYFVYKAPFIMVNMVPPAVLISVIIMFTSMKKKNELTALRTSGISLLKLSKTMMLGSLFIVVAMFLVSEIVVPYTSSKGNRIWNVDVQKQDPGLFYGKEEIWYRGGNAIYWIRQFNPKEKTMRMRPAKMHPRLYRKAPAGFTMGFPKSLSQLSRQPQLSKLRQLRKLPQ